MESFYTDRGSGYSIAVTGFFYCKRSDYEKRQRRKEDVSMNLGWEFFFLSIMLGVGLAMDAFSVSLANGLNEPKMKLGKMIGIAGMFAFFQALMPVIGWVCIHTVVQYFAAFENFIPWIALALLGYIGIKMLIDGIKCRHCEVELHAVTLGALVVQGVATSIDALSVGFTIADYNLGEALLCALVIAVVTFGICLVGIEIGKKVGTKLAGKAGILGGAILIFIGLEIFITSFI
jgi:putative Mn2+ efflux pump MntP